VTIVMGTFGMSSGLWLMGVGLVVDLEGTGASTSSGISSSSSGVAIFGQGHTANVFDPSLVLIWFRQCNTSYKIAHGPFDSGSCRS
jgi:hypothetical protein